MQRDPIYVGIDLKRTGENIALLRDANGLTVKDIQEYMGLGEPRAIYNWLHGRSLPSVEHLRILNLIFGVHIEDIVVWISR